jgi:hypothetical protein
MFHGLGRSFEEMRSPPPTSGIDGVPPTLAKLCQLDEKSTAESSPYFTALHAVLLLKDLACDQITIGRAMAFTNSLENPFKTLLHNKDCISLLLLYLWYCKVRYAVWWVDLRARVECPAICIYLQRHYKENLDILEYLPGKELGDQWTLSSLPRGSHVQ